MIANALELPMADQLSTASADAPAKINLTLEILGRRADGFHDLRSLVIGIDLRDHVTCAVTTRPGLTIDCNDSGVASGENLAIRAADALARRVGYDPRLSIRLEKRIPAGAGLGGGSSDAAATLRLCNRLWGAGLSDAELSEIGASIGSDVPAFFALPGAVVTGRGEVTRRVRLRWRGSVLLVLPGIHISTADVYGAWRPEDSARLPRGTDEAIVRCATAAELSGHLTNHLEPAAFRVCPEVSRLTERINKMGFGPLRMSGSGSTLYRLYDGPEAARRATKMLKDRLPHLRTEVVSAPAGEGSVVSEDC